MGVAYNQAKEQWDPGQPS